MMLYEMYYKTAKSNLEKILLKMGNEVCWAYVTSVLGLIYTMKVLPA